MSNNKYSESDPERTLITLDQLSQTIEVMTSVVNRLRQHLSEQIQARKQQEEEEREEHKALAAEPTEPPREDVDDISVELELTLQDQEDGEDRESFVVEISQPETEMLPKSDKVLH